MTLRTKHRGLYLVGMAVALSTLAHHVLPQRRVHDRESNITCIVLTIQIPHMTRQYSYIRRPVEGTVQCESN